MRLPIYLIAILLASCGGSQEKTENSEEVESEMYDTLSYAHFGSHFQLLELPIHYDSSWLWDGGPFEAEHAQFGYDFEMGKIPNYLLDIWIVDHGESELAEFISAHREYLNEQDGWYNVYAGGSFEENGKEYFMIYVYDKPSQINGAHYYYYFLEFEDEELVEVINLGQEGVYTSTYSEEREEGFLWWRYTTYYAMDITINSGSDIMACEYSRFEVEGDLPQDQLDNVGQPNVFYDTNGVYLEIYPEKCVEY